MSHVDDGKLNALLDGELDGFIDAYLRASMGGEA